MMDMEIGRRLHLEMTRRELFGRSAKGIGAAALASVMNPNLFAESAKSGPALPGLHFAPKAKRVIYLFQSGGPSHLDLFDYNPEIRKLHGQQLPASIRMGQRVTGMTSGQKSFPVVAPMFEFKRHGQSGAWVSELLPHTASIVDDLCIVKSFHTDHINHGPAITFIQSGHQIPGRPCIGSWLSYGIGSANENLPGFMVMISQGSGNKVDQPLFASLWGSGFLPTTHQGVQLRTGKEPVLYLNNPPGMAASSRRRMLDAAAALNRIQSEAYGDPEIAARISQYEMAYRMQTSVPELSDLSDEPKYVLDEYGIVDNPTDGGYARNCLLARRMVERGVRFVQLYHRGWDQHNNLPGQIRGQCRDVDQPSVALINDLKRRGLLDETLVIWGGEFGRTVYSQGKLTATNHGRDHHGRCFTMWMAGGGIKPGTVYGETDAYGYNIVENPVSLHDFGATMLHLLGIDHERLTFRFQGRDYRLTDVHGHVIRDILA